MSTPPNPELASARSSSPLTITIIAHDVGGVGGMETQLARLVTGLLDHGDEVIVLARRCLLPAHPHLRWHRVGVPQRPFSVGYPLFFILGSLAVARHRRGVVHTTGAIVINRADVSTVHHCHRALRRVTRTLSRTRDTVPYLVNAWVSERLKDLAESWCYRPGITTQLVADSSGTAGELRDCFPPMRDRVGVIPIGTDTERFVPSPAAREHVRRVLRLGDSPVALFVGGDWERKGLRYAVEAISRVDVWRLLVVGGGDQGRYNTLAERAGCAARVTFVHRPPDVAQYYAAADCFILPSHYETFSMVTYEAASSGLPLLATRLSGIADLVEDGVTGWFITQDAENIAGRLRELRANPKLALEMGRAARERVAGYSWETMIDNYRSLYARLAEAS